ncbi:glycosyltransferase family 4 protein [Halorubrum ezzemoulense]|uniref:glycosyltransferase family 4 protein n=1 Tax=Halorubrum ezzemoulense TaxID=337243 RepID=UPI00232F43CD|nr:glycosyltransferase family 4 protein [Halorubrum ezzemoulense]MDB9250750.1 glycosyltransferase family 4 protein [Halorubrum ezzemoulense]MDB9260883.1 glycosyltransferase family 4 protein [Halorubrum ezzemoulense]MDB9264291.1 glycosyltransferase family 4 protein [Halorubrum ezzemoulense]MDB9267783.1 glycosyltransferase family 4 protein [Halorubrum ezzemoulense]MDB9271244.1 glycosyltransferase family 4 protein [Halorubrum ezzemoulense]
MESVSILIRSARSLHQPPSGGAGRLMCNIARALSEARWNVDILCPRPETEETESVLENSCTYHTFPYQNPEMSVGRLTGSVRGVRKFRDVLGETKPDVILDDISHIPYYPAHFLSGDSTNAIFMHTAFFNEAWTFNGPIKGTVVNAIDRFLPYMNSPAMVCASESTKKRMTDHTRIDDGHVLNPCIDISDFQYTFDPDSKRLLYLGRITPRKNVRCLIEAWAEVGAKYDDYTLSIAGTGNREESIRQLVDERDIENVEFHGYVDEEKKQRLYRESLLFVVPSLMEGYMTTGLEALASGTPVVGSNTYGIRDYVTDGSNGFLFEPDNSEALASVLDDALADPEALRPLAENGRDVAEAHTFESFKEEANAVFSALADSDVA